MRTVIVVAVFHSISSSSSTLIIRTRLVWFGVGFSLTGAAISHLVWKDLLVDRFALSSDVKQKFDALEG
ncbi:uncharacterized protein [Pyrus communis]|uniref:uncharacterized protein n=1 Tax=Pyrus communis TaxID=23211 RepID=UPI0035C159E0